MAGKTSIVEYFVKRDGAGNRCGYCKSSRTGYSQGMWAHQVTCQDYQDLIDRGWRRSGEYLYKPTMKKTCCPLYTIRCDAVNFRPTKSHKKVIKNMTKFLTDKPTAEGGNSSTTDGAASSNNVDKEANLAAETLKPKEELKPEETEKTVVGADPEKPPCRKAKLIRLERKRQKLASKGNEIPEPVQNKQEDVKSLEELLASQLPTSQSTHKLETKLVRVDMENAEFQASLRQSHTVFAKYQINVHNDSPFECDFNQFKRFLVDSPLVFERNAASPSTGWGSFHEQYYLDGKLVAVGVLDVLPYCVSSVYFYYDPDYSFLSLGVYSVLRELQFTRELNKTSAQLQYYYIGFYAHSCPKMSYKGKYSPSYLACPETYSWIPIEKCLPKLDIAKYSRLDETDKEDPVVEVDTVLIFKGGLMRYGVYRSLFGSRDDKVVREYSQLVGPKVATSMALYRE